MKTLQERALMVLGESRILRHSDTPEYKEAQAAISPAGYPTSRTDSGGTHSSTDKRSFGDHHQDYHISGSPSHATIHSKHATIHANLIKAGFSHHSNDNEDGSTTHTYRKGNTTVTSTPSASASAGGHYHHAVLIKSDSVEVHHRIDDKIHTVHAYDENGKHIHSEKVNSKATGNAVGLDWAPMAEGSHVVVSQKHGEPPSATYHGGARHSERDAIIAHAFKRHAEIKDAK